METLTYNKVPEIDPIHLRRIGDLSYYEGPLLVLYEHAQNNHLYFLDWVDRDSQVNRWLIYRVSAAEVLKFINNQISHLELIKKTSKSQFFVTDIAQGKTLIESSIKNLSTVPEQYLPDADVVFEKDDCTKHYDVIKEAVMNSLGKSKQENSFDTTKTEDFSNVMDSDVHQVLNYSSSGYHFKFKVIQPDKPGTSYFKTLDELRKSLDILRSKISFTSWNVIDLNVIKQYNNFLHTPNDHEVSSRKEK